MGGTWTNSSPKGGSFAPAPAPAPAPSSDYNSATTTTAPAPHASEHPTTPAPAPVQAGTPSSPANGSPGKERDAPPQSVSVKNDPTSQPKNQTTTDGGASNPGPSIQSAAEVSAQEVAETDGMLGGAGTILDLRGQIVRLDEQGDEKFNDGAVKVAIGITDLAQAEQRRKAEGDTPSVMRARDLAIAELGSGMQDIDAGRSIVDQSNGIRVHEARMASVDSSAAEFTKPYEMKLGPEDFNAKENQALNELESETGITPTQFMAAINRGNHDYIVNLAANARGVSMSAKEIDAELPEFPVTQAAARPTLPTHFGTNDAFISTQLMEGPNGKFSASKDGLKAAGSNKKSEQDILTNSRKPAGTNMDPRGLGNVRPLNTEQMFGVPSEAPSAKAAPEERENEGEPSLFRMIHRQLNKRAPDLLKTKVKTAI